MLPLVALSMVSIHARPIGRAMLGRFKLCLRANSFQSTPDQLAGRCLDLRKRNTARCVFQSTPDQLAGRCTVQSAQTGCAKSFNPRPTNWPGDAGTDPLGYRMAYLFQSTPDQLAGRCKEIAEASVLVAVFQSTPDQLAGRCAEGISIPWQVTTFQSTPDQLAGRCAVR